jgi:hypothetical protein
MFALTDFISGIVRHRTATKIAVGPAHGFG